MQALRIGLLRVRQNRALGGLLLVDPPCFLLLAYCCLFLCASEPTGGGPVVQTVGCILMSGFATSPCTWRAALMAACQARTGLTPEPVPPESWTPLLAPKRPQEEPTGLPVLCGACRGSGGWSWCRRGWLSEASPGGVVLLLLAYCAPGGRGYNQTQKGQYNLENVSLVWIYIAMYIASTVIFLVQPQEAPNYTHGSFNINISKWWFYFIISQERCYYTCIFIKGIINKGDKMLSRENLIKCIYAICPD